MLKTFRPGFYFTTANPFSMKELGRFAVVACCVVAFAGCDKTNLKPITQVKIRLTDAPLAAQQVNIHIKEVRVNLTDDTTWIVLHTNADIYNLLDYKNGKDTLIAEGSVPATKFIKEVRIILGDNNTIRIDDEVHPINMLSASANDVRVLINSKLNKNIETFTLDFDAAASIIETSKGTFYLRPVVVLRSKSGS